jgi:hypothetical protein
MSTVPTSFGEIPLDVLVKRYENEKQREVRRYEKRLEFLQTDAGKEWNRVKAKAYYERNKAKVLAKRKATYVPRKAAKSSEPPAPAEA